MSSVPQYINTAEHSSGRCCGLAKGLTMLPFPRNILQSLPPMLEIAVFFVRVYSIFDLYFNFISFTRPPTDWLVFLPQFAVLFVEVYVVGFRGLPMILDVVGEALIVFGWLWSMFTVVWYNEGPRVGTLNPFDSSWTIAAIRNPLRMLYFIALWYWLARLTLQSSLHRGARTHRK